MDRGIYTAQQTMPGTAIGQPTPLSSQVSEVTTGSIRSVRYELGTWLCALRSFFKIRNHPLTDAEQDIASSRDWTNEVRITRQVLLRASELTLALMRSERSDGALLTAAQPDSAATLPGSETQRETISEPSPGSLAELAEAVYDARAVFDGLLESHPVGFPAWSSVGRMLARELENSTAARSLAGATCEGMAAGLQPQLVDITQHAIPLAALASDMQMIFSSLARLLDRLGVIENFLSRDYPLKQTLPIFSLVNEEARALSEVIETRVLRIETLDEAVFNTLDSTSYAITMELRKVFAHELVGVVALRQASPIYDRIENAHGLLRDCFQQSTVRLAQLFDRTLDGKQLFAAFQTRLEQSLALRSDLWMLLQLVRRSLEEPARYSISPLLDKLHEFRHGSLRHLMYKDWESCEHFIEEISIARGAVEQGPVLHRFDAYLSTLHGQVNMRAVLAEHPFDFPALED